MSNVKLIAKICSLIFFVAFSVMIGPAFAQDDTVEESVMLDEEQENGISLNDMCDTSNPVCTLSVDVGALKYLHGQKVTISGKVLNFTGNPVDTKISITVEKDDEQYYKTSMFSTEGKFFDKGFTVPNSGEYNVTVTAGTDKEVITAQNSFTAKGLFYTNVGLLSLLAIGSLVIYLFFNAVTRTYRGSKASIGTREIVRFALITLVISTVIAMFVFTDVQVGQESPLGLVVKDIREDTSIGQPKYEWVINLGGSYQDDYRSGIHVPSFVIVFGLLGGYLRFLYIGSTNWLRDRLSEAHKEDDPILKLKKNEQSWKAQVALSLSNAHDGIFDEPLLKRVLHRKTMQDLVLLFLSPLLATAVYFILAQAGIRGETNFYTLAAVSLGIGLVTDEVVFKIEKFVEGVISPESDKKTEEIEGRLVELEDKKEE